MRHLHYLLLLLPLLGSCSKDDNIPKEIVGSWKLIGFGETNKSDITIAEPSDCDSCYVLNLNDDKTYTGMSYMERLGGSFYINERKQTITFLGMTTDIYEPYSGNDYRDAFDTIHSYSYTEAELKLFYDDDKYLLYKKFIQ